MDRKVINAPLYANDCFYLYNEENAHSSVDVCTAMMSMYRWNLLFSQTLKFPTTNKYMCKKNSRDETILYIVTVFLIFVLMRECVHGAFSSLQSTM